MKTHVLVLDTPSVKQFVFGTDAMAEIRGASALLDHLNRVEMGERLRSSLANVGGRVKTVYANGGSGQFLVSACDGEAVRASAAELARHYRSATGGEASLAFGLGTLEGQDGYSAAVRAAHFELLTRRERGSAARAVPLLPFVRECSSASHLPASRPTSWGEEGTLFLSEASRRKRDQARSARKHGVWAGWMRNLAEGGDWPTEEAWDNVRCEDFEQIGRCSARHNFIGLIYADGNAMGRVVQEVDSAQTCQAFSTIVDESLREACYRALAATCAPEIESVRAAAAAENPLPKLPAEVLLLGGDDLLVAVPADRALDFAHRLAGDFEQRTQQRIAALSAPTRRFFQDRLQDCGFTISCGVALAKASYPFYLLLDLAEQLLVNAKRAGSGVKQRADHYWAPTYIDFHWVVAANSYDLKQVREEDYLITSESPRTLRPLSSDQLERLRAGVCQLRQAGFPRSKIHALFDASIEPSPERSERRIRELFSRCRHGGPSSQRAALWQAVEGLCPPDYELCFPWFQKDERRVTAVADLMESFELFTREG